MVCLVFLFTGKGFAQEWEWQNPLPQGNSLNATWSCSTNDVFAVGYNGTILHYDGNTWSSMPSGTTNNLWSIWGTANNDLFAVGYSGTILHYDGHTWNSMASGTTNYLWGVWGVSGKMSMLLDIMEPSFIMTASNGQT